MVRVVNYFVGNFGDFLFFEFFLVGLKMRFNVLVVFVVVGDVDVRINGILIEFWMSYWVKRGDIFEVGILRSGFYGYIVFVGGVKCEKFLGSCLVYLRVGFGRLFKVGDRFSVGYVFLMGREGCFLF